MTKKLLAEFLGTFWLVMCGCGVAIFMSTPETAARLSVSIAFGLTVITMAYAVGPVSGGHFNPAVTIGLAVAGRTERSYVIPYVIAQTVAGIAAGLVLHLIASATPAYDRAAVFAANGYGVHSPGGYSWGAAFGAELILTAGFVFIIAAMASQRHFRALAPLVTGLALTLTNLVAIPITNASINPARSTGPALVVGDWALAQLWLFWVAPIIGAITGAAIARALFVEERARWCERREETAGPEMGEQIPGGQMAANY